MIFSPIIDAETMTPNKTNPESSLTLLVVDDDEGVRHALSFLFQDHYRVLSAASGSIALEMARRQPVDVVILDIRMPGLSGIQTLEQLKRIDRSIEVIILTGFETIETARQALRLGACDYLGKPFELNIVRDAVSHAFQRRASSREIHNHNHKLAQLQDEVHQQQLREELARTRSEIYASILHDINGPLTVVSGLVEVVNRDLHADVDILPAVAHQIRQNVSAIGRNILNCVEISRRYLGFLQGQTSSQACVPVNDVLRDLSDLLKVHPQARRNQLVIHFLPQPLAAAINSTDLLQILLNLTVNALQASAQMHRVELGGVLKAEAPDWSPGRLGIHERAVLPPQPIQGPVLAMTVQDNGPGMGVEMLDLIFEPYFTTKPAGQGTGLGLSIVRRLVLQAGGGIHLQSEKGEGTKFTVYLPVKPQTPARD